MNAEVFVFARMNYYSINSNSDTKSYKKLVAKNSIVLSILPFIINRVLSNKLPCDS